MTDSTETENRITVRPTMALAQRNRPRGLWGQFTTSLLRPGLFYRTLHPASETRQWLWAALIILALVGVSTVRYSALTGTAESEPIVADPGFVDPGLDGGFGGGGGGIDFGGGDFGGIPPGGEPVDPGSIPADESTLTSDLTMALLAGSNIVLGWIVLTAMLVVVPMLRGRAPKIGQNLQIAVWSSLPLAVMAVVQLLYYAGGGKVGEPGVQGLLGDFKGFDSLSATTQALLISFTSRLTIFWLWSLVLVYFGARFALNGWRIVALLVVIVWAGIQIVAPVVTETITAPVSEDSVFVDSMNGGEFPADVGEIPSDNGELPSDMSGSGESGTDQEQPLDPIPRGMKG